MADLTNAKLDGAYLFQVSNFSHARFDGANLTGAHLYFSEFEGASFRNADLSNARLDGIFAKANFTGARMWATTFAKGRRFGKQISAKQE
jgi:uncharacterized protein YjbI with pentapeptide repeats